MTLCPCCERPLEDGINVKVTDLLEVKMSAHHRVIIGAMVSAYPRMVTMERLVSALYDADPNGGPEDPANTVRSLMTRIRKKLPEYGWSVPINSGGTGIKGCYRLEPVKD